MATKGELMRGGLAGELAQLLGFDYTTGLSGAGTTAADATALTTAMSVFTTVGASTGALLPSATGNGIFAVYNGGSNALTVYSITSPAQTINNGATSFSVTNGKGAIFIAHGNTWLAFLSA